MKLKTLIVTVAVLAALSVVAFLINRPPAPKSADPRIGQQLVDAGTVEKAAKLRISDAGRSVTVARADGKWYVPSYYDMPADFQKLSGFVTNLTDAKLQRLVTSNPERIDRLEFKDTRIELLDGSDKALWSASLGKHPESGGGRFVRFGDEQKAYLTNLSAWLDTEPKNWAQSELINLKPEDVARLEISFPDAAKVTLTRANAEDEWSAESGAGRKVKADKVSSVLNQVGNLRFSDSSDFDDPNVVAARANTRTFKLSTFDGKTVTVAMGRKPEEKKLKPPTPVTEGSGPAALGSLTDLVNKQAGASGDEAKPDDTKLTPEFETIPAGPVYVSISHSDSSAPVNALMTKRAFQIYEYTFTGLPQTPDEMFESAPAGSGAEGTNAPGSLTEPGNP
jgi:hypothetical protein